MPPKKTGPCCDEYVRLHSNIGRRGFSIRKDEDGRASLHYNAVPAHEERKLADALQGSKLVVQAVGRETIRHCPFCGAWLATP